MDSQTSPQLVEITSDIPGYGSFFSSWVCRDDPVVLVDVGPARSADQLIHALRGLSVDWIDYIFLTHIHIDHAGALAPVLERFPMATAVCHEKAIEYLVDPSRLWAGSRKALGTIAERYGRPKPASRERLRSHRDISIPRLRIMETPGHASHHLSLVYGDQLFAGEAGGNYFRVNEKEYLRPATPHKFFMDVCLDSLDRLLSVPDQPLFYAHFGKGGSSHVLLNRSRRQLMEWKDIIERERRKGKGDLPDRCVRTLLKEDPNLSPFEAMPPDIQERERFFLKNSVKGFLGYLETAA
jgi:glyoxylase-like metal-dependent hydrolase (beta-lactamase superfamily II)